LVRKRARTYCICTVTLLDEGLSGVPGENMKREQHQQVQESVRRVHHLLANTFPSLELINLKFDTLAPETRARFEGYWQAAHQQAIQDLCASLTLFDLQSTD